MAMQFINDDFLPRMFFEGTNDFKEMKGESHWIEEVGFNIVLLCNELKDRFIVALYGSDAISPESEGIYYFDDQKEAEEFYATMLREHFDSGDEYDLSDE